MAKTVSVSEARDQLGSYVRWSKDNRDYVIIEVRGKAEAALIPYEELAVLQAAHEAARRRNALAKLEALAAQVNAQAADLSDEEVEALADEVTRDAIQALVDKGKIQFAD